MGSVDLTAFVPFTEGLHYWIRQIEPVSAERERVTLEVWPDLLGAYPTLFFRLDPIDLTETP